MGVRRRTLPQRPFPRCYGGGGNHCRFRNHGNISSSSRLSCQPENPSCRLSETATSDPIRVPPLSRRDIPTQVLYGFKNRYKGCRADHAHARGTTICTAIEVVQTSDCLTLGTISFCYCTVYHQRRLTMAETDTDRIVNTPDRSTPSELTLKLLKLLNASLQTHGFQTGQQCAPPKIKNETWTTRSRKRVLFCEVELIYSPLRSLD